MPLRSSSSQALGSSDLQRRSTAGASGSASPWDSIDDLQEPVLPWMQGANASRQSIGSFMTRSSLDSNARESLHVVKRYQRELDEGRKNKRWTKFKWWLLMTNSLLFVYGLAYLLFALLTFFKFYLRADVVQVGDAVVLGLVTATGALCLLTSFLGYAGLMLNNRPLLAVYNLLLWACLAVIAAIGYYAYRRQKWNLPGKLSYQWHYGLTSDGRARIQANLHCCGYKDFTDFHERSNQCFPRTLLPGCRFKYTQFIQSFLTYSYTVAFSTVGLHLFVLISALMCANHVNRQFGKHLPPKIYRLDYQGIVAGTPTGSSYNLHQQENLQQRRAVVPQ